MWNSYWSGRSRRDIPQVNYNESSGEEDEFDSPLVSPTRPPQTRAGSPVDLAVPTLCDNVDEELEAVSQVLSNVGHTHTFRRTRPQIRPDPEGTANPAKADEGKDDSQRELEEEVEEGHIVGGADSCEVSEDNQPAAMANYDQQNENDDDGAIQNARDCKLPFNKENIKLWFSLIESKMMFAGIKKQWSKRQVLVQLIPPDIHTDFIPFLQMQETEAGALAYYDFKMAIIGQFGPKQADNFDKAISRVLTGKPSELGRRILNDICPKPKPLEGCCCAATVLGIWRRSLPTAVRNAIADLDFTATTYQQVFERADNVYASNAASTPVVAAIGRAEVSAASRGRGNRGGGSGSGRGGQSGRGNRGGGAGGRGGGRGPRHEDNPPQNACKLHWKFGKKSWTCADRHNCPWRDFESPRPKDNRNISAATTMEIID